ncbi:MAG: RNA polymerase sigma factor [Bacilli bacterium]
MKYINKDNLIWKIAYNLWCTKAKKYIKEKNNVTYEDNINKNYKVDMINRLIYKEIATNLDNIGLTKNEKTSFELYYFNDLSIKEISTKINIAAINIKYYLFNARKKIKERYYE